MAAVAVHWVDGVMMVANVAAESFFPPCNGVPVIAHNCTNKASARNRARCDSCEKKHKRIKWRESKNKARAKTRCEAIIRFRELRSVQTEAKRLRESLVTVRHELRETLQKQVSLRHDYQTEIQDARLRACEIDKRNTRLQNENKQLQQIIAKKECRIGELTGAHNDDRANKCELECSGPEGVDKTSDVGGYGDTGDEYENDSDFGVAINLLHLSASANGKVTPLQLAAPRAQNDHRVGGNASAFEGGNGTGDLGGHGDTADENGNDNDASVANTGGHGDTADENGNDNDASVANNLLHLSASVTGKATQLQLAPSPQLHRPRNKRRRSLRVRVCEYISVNGRYLHFGSPPAIMRVFHTATP